MAPFPWLVLLENMAYQQLMKSPTFHRAVESVVKVVHRARHGTPPDELGGTKIDDPNHARFGRHFVDELRAQLGQAEKEQAAGSTGLQTTQRTTTATSKSANSDTIGKSAADDAESAWAELQQRSTEPPKPGFMGEYMDALRGQINQQKKPPP